MKILYLLSGGRDPLCDRIIEAQEPEHQVTVIDLSAPEVSYEAVIDAIVAHDRIITW